MLNNCSYMKHFLFVQFSWAELAKDMIEVVKNYELADGYTIVGGSSMGSATALYTALQNVSNYNFCG